MEKKNVKDKMAVDLGNKKGKENIKNLDFQIYKTKGKLRQNISYVVTYLFIYK